MEPHVLSIQSHVVHGHAGNTSATFPLQVLGFEVDALNSVQFSNHTGYSVYTGQVLNAEELKELYSGLVENKVDLYSHILTGYIYADSFLREVCNIVRDLKEKNPATVYVCDPVMGDVGLGMYVPENLIPIYKEEVLPLADVLTPNQFEAEKLTGMDIRCEGDALAAIELLHALGPRTVVMSSTEFSADGGVTVALASFILEGGKREQYRLSIPRLDAQFVGTGDLFAALLLAYLYRYPGDFKTVIEKVGSTMQHVLRRTLASAKSAAGKSNPTTAQLELKLVQSMADIQQPRDLLTATRI